MDSRNESRSEADLTLSVIAMLDDPRMADVFRIWDEAFPPEEKNPPLFWLQYFAARYHPGKGPTTRYKELIAFHGEREETSGMALLEVTDLPGGEKVGFLRYLAVDASRRGDRIGSRAFATLKRRTLDELSCSLMVWEVEPADLNPVAERRYSWYRRMGGRRVLGIEHSIQMPGQPETPLWVMACHGTNEGNTSLHEAVCAALETRVAVTGNVGLEE